MPDPKRRPPISPAVAIPVGILAVSTSSIFIRYAQADGVSSLVIAAWRLSLAALILAPIALLRYRGELRSLTRRGLALALLSGIFLAIHFATWISSLEYTSVASSVVLVSTAPLWVAILAPLTLREPVGRFVIIGMGLALMGGTIVGLSDSCTLRLNSGQALTGFASLQCPPLSEFVGGEAFLGDLLALAGALAGLDDLVRRVAGRADGPAGVAGLEQLPVDALAVRVLDADVALAARARHVVLVDR